MYFIKKKFLFFLITVGLFEVSFGQSTFLAQELSSAINTKYDEVNPVLSADLTTLYFSRLNDPANGKVKSAIWFSEKKNGAWIAAQPLSELNKGNYNKVLSITADGSQILIAHNSVVSLYSKKDTTWIDAPLPKETSVDASLSADGNVLIFISGGKIFRSEKKDNTWSTAAPLVGFDAKGIHNLHLSEDNKAIYFSRNTKSNKQDLFKIHRIGGQWDQWSSPISLGDTVNTKANEKDVHTTPNGAWAIFSSDKNRDAKSNIFLVKLFEDQPWVRVEGVLTNSVSNKPLINKDVSILINGKKADRFEINKDSGTFSVDLPFGKISKVEASIDHYKARTYTIDVVADREYRVLNMDMAADPLPYVLVKGKLLIKNTAKQIPALTKPKIVVDGEVIDSALVDAINGSYAVKLDHGSSYFIQVTARRFESLPDVLDLSGYDGYEEITLDLQADAEKMAIVKGKISDTSGKSLATHPALKIKVEGVSAALVGVDTIEGVYELRVPLQEKHVISASLPGYAPMFEIIDVSNETKEISLQRDLILVLLKEGNSIRLNNVVFQTGKTALNASSNAELDRFVEFLSSHPELKIEVGGHTDKASRLSTLNMAKAVMNYFTEKGIAKNRLTARGYASTKPLAVQESKEGKISNMRIELTILQK